MTQTTRWNNASQPGSVDQFPELDWSRSREGVLYLRKEVVNGVCRDGHRVFIAVRPTWQGALEWAPADEFGRVRSDFRPGLPRRWGNEFPWEYVAPSGEIHRLYPPGFRSVVKQMRAPETSGVTQSLSRWYGAATQRLIGS